MTDDSAGLDPDVREHLRELADIDKQRRRLRTTLERLPEQQLLRDLAEEQKQTQIARDEVALSAEAVRERARREDRETRMLRERLAAEQQRMYDGGVTNAREQASMQAELDAVTRRIDQHETAELEALEELDGLDTTIDEHDAQLAAFDDREQELTKVRDAAAQQVMADTAQLDVDRDKHRDELPRAIVERYDTIDERTHAGAVGELAGSRCTGCGIELPMVQVDELLTGEPLPACPNCNRMLLV